MRILILGYNKSVGNEIHQNSEAPNSIARLVSSTGYAKAGYMCGFCQSKVRHYRPEANICAGSARVCPALQARSERRSGLLIYYF